jgi:DNA-directed RNA polymerase specialized sigma24 family protein
VAVPIATNRCLNALRDSSRRPHAAGLPAGAAMPENFSEIAWLEPYPDLLLEGIADDAPGPDARYEAKEAVALAFVSGLQHLAPLQRAGHCSNPAPWLRARRASGCRSLVQTPSASS